MKKEKLFVLDEVPTIVINEPIQISMLSQLNDTKLKFGEWVSSPAGEGQFIHYLSSSKVTIDINGIWHDIYISEIQKV